MVNLNQLRIACSTVAHLRAGQVSDRLLRKLRRFDGRRLEGMRWELRGIGKPVPPVRSTACGYDGSSFELLNLRHGFGGGDRWRPRDVPALWRYHLHYFEYLQGLPGARGLALLDDWIAENRPRAAPGWDPYPTSLRVRCWLEWLVEHWPDVDDATRARHLASLALQAELLRRFPERHLQGNHLLENAITLCWAGLRLQGPASDAWLREGEALLAAELAAQLLGDGTHEERSPSYQARLCEGLFRLAAVADVAGGGEGSRVAAMARGAAQRMLSSLARLSHPDGEVALLNDSGIGWAPTAGEIAARFDPGGTGANDDGMWSLDDAGYGGFREGGTYLVFDAGPIGPDHQPGHGHADTLAFELSVAGERLVTDTGVVTYEPGMQRAWDRGTAAHSTVQVDGRDQAELWEAFRCGRRPVVTGHHFVGLKRGEAVLHGAVEVPTVWADSYEHARTLGWGGSRLQGRDVVSAKGQHRAVARFHLAPGVEAVAGASGSGLRLRRDGREIALLAGQGLDWRVARSPYHPDFHVEIERVCAEAEVAFRDRVELEWSIDVGRPI